MRGPLMMLLGLALVAMPSVLAQDAVARCTRQCDPDDRDVNDPALHEGGPVNVVLYFHFEDILNTAPANVFPPDPLNEPDLDAGFPVPTLDNGVTRFDNSRVSFEFCPGGIRYLDDGWFLECMRRLTGEPLRLASQEIPAYVYLSAEVSPRIPNTAPTTGVGVMPRLAFDGQIVERLEGTVGPTGPVLAATAPDDGARFNVVSLPGQAEVYEIRVVFHAQQSQWPAQEGPRIGTIRFSQVDEQGARVTGSQWRFHTGADFRPRLIMPTDNPLNVTLSGRVQDNSLRLEAMANSPFGSYDVDPDSFQLRQVAGPILGPVLYHGSQRSTDHDGTGIPQRAAWDVDIGDARGGLYTFEASAVNRQHTSVTRSQFAIELPAFRGTAVPGSGLVPILIVLASTALAVAACRPKP